MSRPNVGYFIHRVGPDGPRRDRNIENAKRWIRWLVDVTDMAILAPWLAYVISLDETNYRARGIRDGRAFARLQPIELGFICGPEVSDGCAADRDTLLGAIVPVIDLTPLGLEEPPPASDEWRSAMRHVIGVAWPDGGSYADLYRVYGLDRHTCVSGRRILRGELTTGGE